MAKSKGLKPAGLEDTPGDDPVDDEDACPDEEAFVSRDAVSFVAEAVAVIKRRLSGVTSRVTPNLRPRLEHPAFYQGGTVYEFLAAIQRDTWFRKNAILVLVGDMRSGNSNFALARREDRAFCEKESFDLGKNHRKPTFLAIYEIADYVSLLVSRLVCANFASGSQSVRQNN